MLSAWDPALRSCVGRRVSLVWMPLVSVVDRPAEASKTKPSPLPAIAPCPFMAPALTWSRWKIHTNFWAFKAIRWVLFRLLVLPKGEQDALAQAREPL